jgi:hypothetical protein
MKNKKFIIKANKKHNFTYDYSLTKYIGSHSKIKIICLIHGVFEQTPTNHLSGNGCYQCGLIKKATKKKKIPASNFISKSNIIHNNKYDYSLVEYFSAKSRVIIICPTHGKFEQSPNAHLSGKGCVKCFFENANILQKLDQNIIIERFVETHGNKYDYSCAEYDGMNKKIKIICPTHGLFLQLPGNHISGQGCKKCSNNISKAEKQYLDYIGISDKYRNFTLKINGRLFKVDGFDPETNTIYEFNGDFWHGNPKKFKADDINPRSKKSFGELYSQTIDRQNILINSGYKVISMWENDWNTI